MKTTKRNLGPSRVAPEPEPGWSVWLESAHYFTAETVPSTMGPHDYAHRNPPAGHCQCGCWIDSFDQGGPVDPRGPCPIPADQKRKKVRYVIKPQNDDTSKLLRPAIAFAVLAIGCAMVAAWFIHLVIFQP